MCLIFREFLKDLKAKVLVFMSVYSYFVLKLKSYEHSRQPLNVFFSHELVGSLSAVSKSHH